MADQRSNLVQAGVHSVEGTIGGARAVGLARQREAERAAMEKKRAEIAARNTGELPTFTKASNKVPPRTKTVSSAKV